MQEDFEHMQKENNRQDGRVVMLPAATRNYVSSILTPDFSKDYDKSNNDE